MTGLGTVKFTAGNQVGAATATRFHAAVAAAETAAATTHLQ
jgi:hypothetical protein